MLSGDSFSVFTGLLFFAGGTAVTAYTVSGSKARDLWLVTGLLVALSAAWWIWSARLAIPATAALNVLWFLIPLVTVSLVAVLIRDRGAMQIADAPANEGGVPTSLLIQISSAISDADWEDYTPSPSIIEKYVAVLESTFTSLRKQYGFDTPKLERPHGKASLILGVNYLRRVQPFLKAGHVDEAKEAAATFMRG